MKQGWLTVLQRLHNLQNNKANASVNTSDSYSNQVFSNSNSPLSQWRWVNIEDTKPKNKKRQAFISPWPEFTPACQVRSATCQSKLQKQRDLGGHPDYFEPTTRYIQAICIALPHLHTDTQTGTHNFWTGWHVCLGKVGLSVKFAYAVTSSL